jgi:membrane protease YdiL (CAAX protease family)
MWHLPLLLTGLNYPGVDVRSAIIVFIFVPVALSFTYTWFYVASSGSVLAPAAFHASANLFSDAYLGAAASLGGEPI